MRHFIDVAELKHLIEQDSAMRLLDVRWRLDRPDGRGEYLSGHLPGAVYVDLHTELASPGRPEDGRHPEPSTEQLQAAARRWGLRQGDLVVVYDDANGVSAARAWWLLRQAGVEVRVLDGGLRAWVAAGGELQRDEYTPERGDIELVELGRGSVSIDEAAEFPASGVLLDVRAPERYRGETEPLDPIAGHIPGAVNLPTAAHLSADGILLDAQALRATFAAVGVTDETPVATYCGSGVTAAHTALVLAELGIEAKVYPGSWSQWSNTPGRPIATGSHPTGAHPNSSTAG